jgi:hypothetical protein
MLKVMFTLLDRQTSFLSFCIFFSIHNKVLTYA